MPTSTTNDQAELNKALVRKLIDGFNREDPSVIDELVAEDCVLHGTPPGPARDVWKAQFADTHATFNPIHVEIEVMVAEGDLVVVREWTTATQVGPFLGFESSGKDGAIRGMMMVQIVDGQIVARWQVNDFLMALIQMGHLAPPSS